MRFGNGKLMVGVPCFFDQRDDDPRSQRATDSAWSASVGSSERELPEPRSHGLCGSRLAVASARARGPWAQEYRSLWVFTAPLSAAVP